MNAFEQSDPAKDLAVVLVTVFQVLCGLAFCGSIYMIYLASLDLLSDWTQSIKSIFFHFTPEENSQFWGMAFFAVPAIGALISFFVLDYLKKVIRKE